MRRFIKVPNICMIRKRQWSRRHCQRKTYVQIKKVTTSEEVDKGTENLDDMKEAVVTIRGKDLDNFGGQSKGSTG